MSFLLTTFINCLFTIPIVNIHFQMSSRSNIYTFFGALIAAIFIFTCFKGLSNENEYENVHFLRNNITYRLLNPNNSTRNETYDLWVHCMLDNMLPFKGDPIKVEIKQMKNKLLIKIASKLKLFDFHPLSLQSHSILVY